MANRSLLRMFQLANDAYIDTVVTFYKVDLTTYERTDELATLYSSISGSDLEPNPYTLDGEGKFRAPVYFDYPVIGVITGSELDSHETGVVFPQSGTWRGNWSNGTTYFINDIVIDGSGSNNSGNLLISTTDHVSDDFDADVLAGRLLTIVDVDAIAQLAIDEVGITIGEAPSFKPTGSSVPPTGMYLAAANTLGFSSNGRVQLKIQEDPDPLFPASGTDISTHLVIGGHRCEASAADGSVFIMASGTGQSTGSYTLRLTATGQYGGVHMIAGGYIQGNFGWGGQVSDHGTYVNFTGAAAGNSPAISAQKTYVGDSDAFGLSFYTQGQGPIVFAHDNAAVVSFRILRTASGVNNLAVYSAATGNSPVIAAEGANTNVSMKLLSKGTGLFDFYTGGGLQFQVANAANAVNWLSASGAGTGGKPALSFQGESTVGGVIYTAGTGPIDFYSDNVAVKTFSILRTASGVNYPTVQGSATGQIVYFGAAGSDTNVALGIRSQGTGTIYFYTGGGLQFAIGNTASAANYMSITGAASGGSPSISSQGNGGLVFYTTAAKDIEFYTSNTSKFIMSLQDTGIVKFANSASFAANASVATVLGSVGPTGASTTVQQWLKINNDSGTARYIPCF